MMQNIRVMICTVSCMFFTIYRLHVLYKTFQFAERAVGSQPSRADAENRAKRFKEKYIGRLKDLKENPW